MDGGYFYAGPAHLGSYMMAPGRDGTRPTAEFSLGEKLPREVWLKFGGYPGWLVEVHDHAERVASGDLAAFERLVSELPRQEFSLLRMTRYEDSLTLYTNARRGWLMYLRSLEDRAMYPLDPEYSGAPESKEIFGCVCGVELDYLACRTLPRELAMRAAVEFFVSGQLPVRFHWESE
jgi:hypothetical protein